MKNLIRYHFYNYITHFTSSLHNFHDKNTIKWNYLVRYSDAIAQHTYHALLFTLFNSPHSKSRQRRHTRYQIHLKYTLDSKVNQFSWRINNFTQYFTLKFVKKHKTRLSLRPFTHDGRRRTTTACLDRKLQRWRHHPSCRQLRNSKKRGFRTHHPQSPATPPFFLHTQYLNDVMSYAARLVIGLTHHALNNASFVIRVPHVATYSTRIRIFFKFCVNNFDWTNSIISVIEINQF